MANQGLEKCRIALCQCYRKKLPELQVAPSLPTADRDCHTVRDWRLPKVHPADASVRPSQNS